MEELYNIFNQNENLRMFPSIRIPISESDKYEEFNLNKTNKTLQFLSYKYYGNPQFFPILLYANQFSDESDIPDSYILRIPFPDTTVLAQIKEDLKLYKRLYC